MSFALLSGRLPIYSSESYSDTISQSFALILIGFERLMLFKWPPILEDSTLHRLEFANKVESVALLLRER